MLKAVAFAVLLGTGLAAAQSEWEGTGCVMDADTELMKCLGNYAWVSSARRGPSELRRIIKICSSRRAHWPFE